MPMLIHTTVRQADQSLVDKIQAGDTQAFNTLATKYRQRIQRLHSRLVRNADEADDLTQETFIKAFKALPGFRGESAFFTWLYRIGINTAKTYYAARDRRPPSSTDLSSEDVEGYDDASLLQNPDTPERLLMAKQVAETIDRAMDALPDDWRATITMREIDGKNYEEIAEVMGCPIGTVRSRIFRAREVIAEQLRPLLDTKAGQRW